MLAKKVIEISIINTQRDSAECFDLSHFLSSNYVDKFMKTQQLKQQVKYEDITTPYETI